MYITRHAEETVKELASMFGAVLVAGPRQVGKTTMLEKLTDGINHATLDDPIVRESASLQSGTFFKDNPPPVFVDEIQKAPELFEQIKLLLDRSRKKGQFYMCGSQQFKMMKGVSESLAGRIGLVTLLGLSLREINRVDFDQPFIPTDEYFTKRKSTVKNTEYSDIWNTIHRGSMPELVENSQFNWQIFYSSYVRTYIERDVRELSEIGDTVKFTSFMTAAAAATGQLLNLASLYGSGKYQYEINAIKPSTSDWINLRKFCSSSSFAIRRAPSLKPASLSLASSMETMSSVIAASSF